MLPVVLDHRSDRELEPIPIGELDRFGGAGLSKTLGLSGKVI
jgi:hypothetical protein